MHLNLERPLVFFDLETTGVNTATDRIVEIALLKVQPDGSQSLKVHRINPTIPIPKQSTVFHGITDEDIKDAPTFNDLAPKLFKFIFGCDLAGYNSNKFDVPLLVEEFLRAGIDFDVRAIRLVDVQNIFHKMEQRTLSAAYQFYCDKDLTDAHSAEADTVATFEILKAQLARYENLENEVNFLHEFSKRHNTVDLAGRFIFDDDGQELFNFGKHKGQPVEKVLRNEPAYYGWMMGGDFALDTKKVLTDIRNRMKQSGKPS